MSFWLIKAADPGKNSKKYATYIPLWRSVYFIGNSFNQYNAHICLNNNCLLFH